VVIPAFNEESRIQSTLERIVGFLRAQSYPWEVVVADDGSTDGTARLAGKFVSSHEKVKLLTLEHRGKGWAVKNGMLRSTGEYRLLCDADLSVPIEQVERLLPPQLHGVDIAVGSREMPDSQRFGEPAYRHLMGRVYNGLVRVLAVPGLKDTQCGFKCYRGEIVPRLFGSQRMDGFAFDSEVMYLASKAGLTIKEIGVDWYYGRGSKVRPVTDSLTMTGDLLKIRWNYKKGRYPDFDGTNSVE
jgi:dolichyl-phosphate beta-glucosyltransferase